MKEKINYITIDGRGNHKSFMDCVMKSVEELKPNEGIHIIKEFEPFPMYKMMEGKGFEKYVEKISDEEFHVYFSPWVESEDVKIEDSLESDEQDKYHYNNEYAITAETKIGDLVKEYPFIKDYLLDLSPKFNKLKNPVIFKTMALVATLEMISKKGDIDIMELIDKIVKEIDSRK